jgi:RimJ/RimL family protein N-acetyltransferase
MTDLSTWAGARCPGNELVRGASVSLQPLSTSHQAALWSEAAAAADGGDARLWEYLPYGPFSGEASFAAWLSAHVADPKLRPYAIVPHTTGEAAGTLSLMRCKQDHGSIEIGHVWFGPSLQRTSAATAAIYAAAAHAFGPLGHRRLEWKCDAGNERSRAAAARLGFTYEGTFRQHMVVKGRNRDTAWFAITDTDWPAVNAAFEAWIAPDNSDADGRQIRSLAAFRSDG